jgi:hypothetical protein
MKEYDWSHKMKPSEYKKVKAWCNENGYKEIDQNLSSTNFPLCKHMLRCDGFDIELCATGSRFVDSNQKFIYLNVTMKARKALSTGFLDIFLFSGYVSTLDEIKSFIAKKEEFIKTAREIGI